MKKYIYFFFAITIATMSYQLITDIWSFEKKHIPEFIIFLSVISGLLTYFISEIIIAANRGGKKLNEPKKELEKLKLQCDNYIFSLENQIESLKNLLELAEARNMFFEKNIDTAVNIRIAKHKLDQETARRKEQLYNAEKAVDAMTVDHYNAVMSRNVQLASENKKLERQLSSKNANYIRLLHNHNSLKESIKEFKNWAAWIDNKEDKTETQEKTTKNTEVLPVGSSFFINGEKFKLVKEDQDGNCDGCDLKGNSNCLDAECRKDYRADKTGVIVKKIS